MDWQECEVPEPHAAQEKQSEANQNVSHEGEAEAAINDAERNHGLAMMVIPCEASMSCKSTQMHMLSAAETEAAPPFETFATPPLGAQRLLPRGGSKI